MTNPQNIIPPKKGEPSRNPKGRGKGHLNTSTRMRRLFDLVVKKKNPITGKDEKFTGAEMLDMAIFARALKGDVIAYREIMDRVEGKVSQPLDMTMETIQPTTSLTVLHSKIEDEPKGN